MKVNSQAPSWPKGLLLALVLVPLGIGCGGTASVSGPTSTISISPQTATTTTGHTVSFTAVTNRTDAGQATTVNWSVQENGGGSVDASGRYTAPQTPGTYHVVATSAAETSMQDTATVTVTQSQSVSVSISPPTASVQPGGTVAFTATVIGTQNMQVTWSVQENGGGTVDASGLYTAPATEGTYHVAATSAVDPTQSATATVTVSRGTSGGWLHTSGNHILTSDGRVWHGRGANLHDTRSCNACAYNPPNVGEVNRRIDELVDVWGANFIRLDLESYASPGGRVSWQGVLSDPAYLSDIRSIVDHIKTKNGVYVLVSLWVDPTFTSLGWPTTQTADEWVALANSFINDSQVLFGLVNEPQQNWDGSLDAQVWNAMNDTVATIRSVEDSAGASHHIISVQGTGGWARRLDYYVTRPIAAGGGENIAYEVHVYDPASAFPDRFENPSRSLPVIIGEFGPAFMTEADCATLMQRAEQLEIPHLAWTFHMRCSPNLLVDHSGGGCGVNMQLEPTSWGQLLKNRLAQPW